MTEIEALEGGAPTLVERAGAAFDKFARAAKVGAICCGAACCCRRCRCCRLLLLLLLRAGRRGSTERSVLPLGGWSKEPNLGTACRTAPALFGGRGGKCLRCLRAKETQVAVASLCRALLCRVASGVFGRVCAAWRGLRQRCRCCCAAKPKQEAREWAAGRAVGAPCAPRACPRLACLPPHAACRNAQRLTACSSLLLPQRALRTQPVVHYGFVPFVIIVGMSLEPRPSLLSLIQII